MVKSLIDYIRSKSSATQFSVLHNLLSQTSMPDVGLILTERLINVPSEVVPPMYTMLQEEIQWALEEKEPYNFTHYLIISKTYEEVASKLDQEDDRPQKKTKKSGSDKPELFYFHPEDEVLQKHAMCYGNYDYTNPQSDGQSDSKRAFQELGIRPSGHMMLLEAPKLEGAVAAVQRYLNPES